MNPNEGRYVVGVDFGTTFTSVAFAYSESPEVVTLANNWPGGASCGRSAVTVPTELHYTRLNPLPREFQWGYAISPPSKTRPESLKWFKLLLQNDNSSGGAGNDLNLSQALRQFSINENTSLSRYNNIKTTPACNTSAELRRLGLQPTTVVQDYLSKVREVAVERLESAYLKEFVNASRIEYVVTVPAIWKDAAKWSMVRACEGAGFGKHREGFHLVSEPEAAAAHSLKVIQPQNLKKNDTFIVCDAGRGTVDLISYEVRSLEPLTLNEVVSGTGDLCGSVYLDNRFMAYMEKLLGKDVMEKMKPVSRHKMEMDWRDQVKLRFAPASSNAGEMEYDVLVPGIADDPEKDIEIGYHTMKHKDVQAIFDPIVDRITRLVDQQVRAVEARDHTVAAVLLVGGFGSSPYLLHCLKEAKYGVERKSLEVIQPAEAETAVVRGALLRGLDGSCVQNQYAKRFYGITIDTVACIHTQRLDAQELQHTYISAVTGRTMIENAMRWYVKRNELFDERHSVEVPVSLHVPKTMNPSLMFDMEIFATDQDEAPKYKWASGGEDIYQICTLHADLSEIPRATLPIEVGRLDGLLYYVPTVDIKATMDSAVLKFELLYQGITYGTVEVASEGWLT